MRAHLARRSRRNVNDEQASAPRSAHLRWRDEAGGRPVARKDVTLADAPNSDSIQATVNFALFYGTLQFTRGHVLLHDTDVIVKVPAVSS